MATLDELDRQGLVEKVEIENLRRLEFEDRQIYLFLEVKTWLEETVPDMAPFYGENIAPIHQAFGLFKDFITGVEFDEGEMFWRMRPAEDDIYELRTADLRFFGWFYRPKVIILARGDTFERLHTYQGMHAGYRDEVRRLRDAIPLDEPKFVVGARPEDVF